MISIQINKSWITYIFTNREKSIFDIFCVWNDLLRVTLFEILLFADCCVEFTHCVIHLMTMSHDLRNSILFLSSAVRCEIVDTYWQKKNDYPNNSKQHQINDLNKIQYKKIKKKTYETLNFFPKLSWIVHCLMSTMVSCLLWKNHPWSLR